MKIVSSVLILLFCVSCNSDFTSIEQAKNEVNKQGYREGRWVDYLDSSDVKVEDASKGYQRYILGEFDGGKLLAGLKLYSSKGVLQAELVPFTDEQKLIEKSSNLLEDISFERLSKYNENGKVYLIMTANKKGLKIAEKVYTPENGSLLFEKNIDYYDNGLKKSVSGVNYSEDSLKVNYYMSFAKGNFWDNNLEKFKNLRKIIEKKIIEECKRRNIPSEFAVRPENIRELPYSMEFLVVNSDTIFVQQLIKSEIDEYNNKISRQNNQNKRNSESNSSKNNANVNSDEYVRHVCSYCSSIFYGKGYYIYYGRNDYGKMGEHMGRSNDDNQELCCSSSCANKIMQVY